MRGADLFLRRWVDVVQLWIIERYAMPWFSDRSSLCLGLHGPRSIQSFPAESGRPLLS